MIQLEIQTNSIEQELLTKMLKDGKILESNQSQNFRSTDPTIVVALIGGGFLALSSLLTPIVEHILAVQREKQKANKPKNNNLKITIKKKSKVIYKGLHTFETIKDFETGGLRVIEKHIKIDDEDNKDISVLVDFLDRA